MQVSYRAARRAALICLALPAFLFVLGFLRWYFALPLAALLAFALFFALKTPREQHACTLQIPTVHFVLLLLAVGLWCYLSGLGNLYYQSADWSARNAVFRDLITHDWPVIYTAKNAALVYYIGYWLPAAIFGKLVLALSKSVSVAFFVGNAFLWLFSVICVFLVLVLALFFVRAKRPWQMWLALAVFVFFSGLDIVGTLYNTAFLGKEIPNHLEWWAFTLQFSSLSTCLGWVFNQAVPAWLATACFLCERNGGCYAFVLVCALASSPFGCVGLAVYMLGALAVYFYRALNSHTQKAFLRSVLTPQNLIALLFVLPVWVLYYKTNLAFNLTKAQQNVRFPLLLALLAAALLLGACMLLLSKRLGRRRVTVLISLAVLALLVAAAVFTERITPQYVAFLALECGVYLALLWHTHRRDVLWYLTLLVALICPIPVIGTGADFAMRASMPAVFVLCLLCIRFLVRNAKRGSVRRSAGVRVCCILLVITLSLGAVTPMFEFARGFSAVLQAGELALVNDGIGSFERLFAGGVGSTDKNFIAKNYAETFFFKYLARRGR